MWLRARWYGAGRGGFASRDPYAGDAQTPYSLLYYQYGYSNPVGNRDPSGASPLPPLREGDDVTLANAIRTAKFIYDKTVWCHNRSDDGQHLTDEVPDLWFDYICEYGSTNRIFNADAALTKQLAHTLLVARMRQEFYRNGPFSSEQSKQMEPSTFLDAKIFDSIITNRLISITDFLGGLNAWRVSDDTSSHGSRTVRFELYNVTGLMSGTRIGFTRDGTQEISFEQYLANPSHYNAHGETVVDRSLIDTTRYSIISILSNRIRRDPTRHDGLGGGTMSQRFMWEEAYNPCPVGAMFDFPPIYMTEDYGLWS